MYKTQIACAIFILFIGVLYSRSAGSKKGSSKWFEALLGCSFFQLIFDALSVYTVNHLEMVSPVVNRIIHIVFMGLMQVLFYLAYRYLETVVEEEIEGTVRKYRFTIIPLLLTMTGNIFLPIHYVESARSNYSYGPAAYMTYIGVAVYVFFIIQLMFRYGKQIPQKKKRLIYVALWSEIPVAVYQIAIPDALVTCIGTVLLNLGIYMTTENPDALLAEQLAKEKQRADSANAAKTKFLANMSHEIRTPITAVLGMNELILRETKDSIIKQYSRDIEGAAKSLLSIINDILDITKIEAGKLSVISTEYDFGLVLKDVINMISFKAKVKGLDFNVLADENIPHRMMGDDIRLRQILVNLLNNAVKYTHKGSVTLQITRKQSEEGAAKLFFQVKDTGIGIKEEDLEKLCQPFERIEEKRNRNIEGTGLGMSITKQLLGLLNSELKVTSVYGEGSEFAFELIQEIVDEKPIGRLEDLAEPVSKEYQHGYEAPEAHILFVDDNELNRKVFAGLLKATKIQVDEAGNGKEGLEKVKKNAYDIIFMDHLMPELDGVETFRIMKEMEDFPSKNTPVVILTANALVGAKEKYLQEGFRAFLQKPIDYEKLEALIWELLDKDLIQEASCGVASAELPEEKEVSSATKDTELPMVEGLDWKYAKTHFRDETIMLDTVKFFANAIPYEGKELEGLFADIGTDSGRKDFCTKVHSMKNSAATIGIIPLAGMAKVLEDAARNHKIEVLQSMTPIFLESWFEYGKRLEVFVPVSDTDKMSAAEHGEEIQKLIISMNQAAEEMDIDALDEIWNRLSEYQFSEEKQEFLEQIHKAVIEFDVDYLQTVKCNLI